MGITNSQHTGLINHIDSVLFSLKTFHSKTSDSFRIYPCVLKSGYSLSGIDHSLSWLFVPLIFNSELTGSIILARELESSFKDYDLAMVSSFAGQISAAVKNAWMYEEIKRLAVIDGLTGLYNRRHFFELAEKEFSATKRYHRDLALLMIDVDHFKDFNDKYGHNTGDLVLKLVADTINNSLRKSDFCGRYGGEEFVILAPMTVSDQALIAAQRLRSSIENAKLPINNYSTLSITISIGISVFSDTTETLAELIKKADELLYKAKRNGRNRVEYQ